MSPREGPTKESSVHCSLYGGAYGNESQVAYVCAEYENTKIRQRPLWPGKREEALGLRVYSAIFFRSLDYSRVQEFVCNANYSAYLI